ncbi:MAG: hypothetical protein M3380_22070 [Chloroflexota bacterium]|nr:hypothetical protein [Chloroflexota bacterium]
MDSELSDFGDRSFIEAGLLYNDETAALPTIGSQPLSDRDIQSFGGDYPPTVEVDREAFLQAFRTAFPNEQPANIPSKIRTDGRTRISYTGPIDYSAVVGSRHYGLQVTFEAYERSTGTRYIIERVYPKMEVSGFSPDNGIVYLQAVKTSSDLLDDPIPEIDPNGVFFYDDLYEQPE